MSFSLLLGSVALATEITCPSEESLAGEFETEVQKGFTPSKLRIRKISEPSSYSVTLDSYWAPKPFDDGSLGTVGNFKGDPMALKPWSCTGFVEIRLEESNQEQSAPACSLRLRFTDASRVEVTALGQCDHFHGNLATPAGSYLRRRHEL